MEAVSKSYLLVVAAVTTFLATAPAEGERMQQRCNPVARGAVIHLPGPRLASAISVEEALRKRRSVRRYRDEPLNLPEVAQLLWAAQGVTSPNGLRAAPSAGALYPLELYLMASRVKDLHAGVYRYIPGSHTMVAVKQGELRTELALAAWNQAAIRNAPASLVFSAVYARTTGKYGERGIRYVHIDLGHAAENVYLQGVALGLGTVDIGAFDDDAVAKLLCLPAAEEPLLIMPVGKPYGSE